MKCLCIFVWENKSLTNVGEFVKSWTTVEEYVCLQTLLRMFPPGIPTLLFEEKLRWEILKTLWGNVYSCLGKEFRSLGCLLLYWGVEVELISGRVQVS